jgi:hypothetical protein
MAPTEERVIVRIDAQSDKRLTEMLQWCDQFANESGYRKSWEWDFDHRVLVEEDTMWFVVFKFDDTNVASMFRLRWI